MIIEKIKTEYLKPAKYNPRKDLKPGDPEYEKLRRSMQEFGCVEPIVWNKKTGNVVGGHQRLKILLKDGATEIECVVVELNQKREKALNIALNKIQGEWDIPKLEELLNELNTGDFDVGITGFDTQEIENLLKNYEIQEIDNGEYWFNGNRSIPSNTKTIVSIGNMAATVDIKIINKLQQLIKNKFSENIEIAIPNFVGWCLEVMEN